MYRFNSFNSGEFYECDFDKNFTYRETKNEWALSHGLKHEIDCGVDLIRFANIRKTVANVCVDEASNGTPVTEKWYIKKHVVFRINSAV
jgi:hypothetical protein